MLYIPCWYTHYPQIQIMVCTFGILPAILSLEHTSFLLSLWIFPSSFKFQLKSQLFYEIFPVSSNHKGLLFEKFSSFYNPSMVHILLVIYGYFREGNGTPLQYSCLENPMDGGAWKAAVHGVAEGQTWLSDFTFTHWRRKWQPTPVSCLENPQVRGSLVDCCLWGSTESDTAEAT